MLGVLCALFLFKLVSSCFLVFFFFQAEDGIRDLTVTGVQTCALPIYPSCASCHSKIDPPGLALENFDVMGAWRDRYRATAEDGEVETGFGKNGWPLTFHYALPV